MAIVYTMIDRLSKYLAVLGGACLILLVCVMFFVIISRKVFNYGAFGGPETAMMCQVGLTMLSGSYVLLKEEHIGVVILLERLNLRQRSRMLLASSLLGCLISVVMLAQSWVMTQSSLNNGLLTPDTGTPYVWLKMLFVLGFGSLTLQFVSQIRKHYLQAKFAH